MLSFWGWKKFGSLRCWGSLVERVGHTTNHHLSRMSRSYSLKEVTNLLLVKSLFQVFGFFLIPGSFDFHSVFLQRETRSFFSKNHSFLRANWTKIRFVAHRALRFFSFGDSNSRAWMYWCSRSVSNSSSTTTGRGSSVYDESEAKLLGINVSWWLFCWAFRMTIFPYLRNKVLFNQNKGHLGSRYISGKIIASNPPRSLKVKSEGITPKCPTHSGLGII